MGSPLSSRPTYNPLHHLTDAELITKKTHLGMTSIRNFGPNFNFTIKEQQLSHVKNILNANELVNTHKINLR